VAIVATAVGHLLNRELAHSLRGLRVLMVGMGFLLGCVGAGIYAQSAAVGSTASEIDPSFAVTSSLIIAPCALVLSLACLIVAEAG
jgi:hypothetical protein